MVCAVTNESKMCFDSNLEDILFAAIKIQFQILDAQNYLWCAIVNGQISQKFDEIEMFVEFSVAKWT